MNTRSSDLNDPKLTSAKYSRALPLPWMSASLNIPSTWMSCYSLLKEIKGKLAPLRLYPLVIGRKQSFSHGVNYWSNSVLPSHEISRSKENHCSREDHCYPFSYHHYDLTSQSPSSYGIGRVPH